MAATIRTFNEFPPKFAHHVIFDTATKELQPSPWWPLAMSSSRLQSGINREWRETHYHTRALRKERSRIRPRKRISMSVLFCLKQNDRKILPLKWLRIDQTTSLSFEHVYHKSRADKIANRGESQGDRFPVLFSQKKSFRFETVFISVYRRSKADDRQKTCQKVLNSFSSKTSLV